MTREVFARHAAERSPVLLVDDRLGTVLWVYRDSPRAKVKVEGRHLVVPVESLRLATVHGAEPGESVVSCCGREIGSMGDRDRVALGSYGVTCPGTAPESPLEQPETAAEGYPGGSVGGER